MDAHIKLNIWDPCGFHRPLLLEPRPMFCKVRCVKHLEVPLEVEGLRQAQDVTDLLSKEAGVQA